jgi:triphosphoribosyl-dephospho-CoA synthetase
MKADIALELMEFANQAMCYELLTYPSFGLVSPYSKGSHEDMDHFTFIDSISVLNKYMYLFAKNGYQDQPLSELFDTAIQIGIECEKDMFTKTRGINTHKGLIFVLGTLISCSARALYYKEGFDQVFKYCQTFGMGKLEEFEQLNQKEKLSHGEMIYLKEKIGGVRQEAALGFPILQQAWKWVDFDHKDSLVKTLIYLMGHCEDTTIIHRCGLETLEEVQRTMKQIVQNGFNLHEINEIEAAYIERGISPGGSADLLVGAIYLARLHILFEKK